MTLHEDLGSRMWDWAKDLFPVCRSITGHGVRETLTYLHELLPGLAIVDVPTGTQAMDWTVPDEWNIRDAWVEDEHGKRVIDFNAHNLHVVGYSEPTDEWMELEELLEHLYSLPEQPNAIPYVTSYYQRCWGFCLSHKQREKLKLGRYRAVVDSDLKPGVLNYGELVIPGESEEEVLLSTYVCHPSMANNELSGPVVTTAIAQWLQSLSRRRYTYRIVFIPETIGSLVYLSRHLDNLQKQVVAGYVVTCIGDERCYSYLPSRNGETLSDRAAQHALKYIDYGYCRYRWLDRGSDERQYCAPGVDLPIATIMRSKYGTYPEYHTSLDDLELVTPAGLQGGFSALKSAIEIIEANERPIAAVLGEPQLGRRGHYPTISKKGSASGRMEIMMNLLTYSDGKRDLIEIGDTIGFHVLDLAEILEDLREHGLVSKPGWL